LIDSLNQTEQSQSVPFPEYENDPVGFIRDVLEVPVLTQEQVEIAESIRSKQITNVQAANGVGKSWIASALTTWWVFSVGGLCITTAPSEQQVKEILWSEIRKLYSKNKHKLGGDAGVLFMRHTETARAYGFTSKDYDANAFQGKHAARQLLILDEACGISKEIDEAAESCVTGSENRILRIGNPIQNRTPFSAACARSHIRIPAWNHPNVAWAYEMCEDGIHRLKPDVAVKILNPNPINDDDLILPVAAWDDSLPRDVIPGAISVHWIETKARPKGEDSPFWISRVEGRFARASKRSLVPADWWYAARARYGARPFYWDALAKQQHWRYGLDVGDGGDNHALSGCRGPVVYFALEEVTKGDREDTSRAAALVWRHLRETGGVAAVDRMGVGAGALSEAIGLMRKEAMHGCSLVGYATQEREILNPAEKKQFKNRISRDAWSFREACRKGEIAIAPIPKSIEDKLVEQLEATEYDEDAQGRTFIEEKDDTKKKLDGESPDLRDGLLMCWNLRVAPMEEGSAVGKQRQSRAATDGFIGSGPSYRDY
jgi:hypothetical protein